MGHRSRYASEPAHELMDDQRVAGAARPAAAPRPHRAAAAGGDAGWNFANVPARTGRHAAPSDKTAEQTDEDEDLEPGVKATGRLGEIVGGVIGGLAGVALGGLFGGIPGAIGGGLVGAYLGARVGGSKASSATLALSNDTYADDATQSIKKVQFDVGIPPGQDAHDYALVQWLKGYMKQGSGSYFKAVMYGSTVDANYSDYQIDSKDADPVYASNATGRWNYSTTSTGFYSSDKPGPALTSEHGADYALQFKMGLYKIADVPTTTSGTISATPVAMVPWQYSVKVDKSGSFTHPAL